jgi:hypothetical protein
MQSGGRRSPDSRESPCSRLNGPRTPCLPLASRETVTAPRESDRTPPRRNRRTSRSHAYGPAQPMKCFHLVELPAVNTYRIQRADGSIEGPFSAAVLRSLAEQGRIGQADRISPDGSDRWFPATRVKGIRENLEPLILTENLPPIGSESTPDPLGHPGPSPQVQAPTPDVDRSAIQLARTHSQPRYGVLRCVAGWLASYGWLVISLGFTISFLATAVLGFDALDPETPWSAGTVVIVTLNCLAAGTAVMLASRSFARRGDPLTAGFGVVVLLPVVPFTIDGIRENAVSIPDAIVFLQAILLSLSTLISGSILIAAGEFLTAHADIATNSWRDAG